jgi:hypothetical protein
MLDGFIEGKALGVMEGNSDNMALGTWVGQRVG